MHATLITFESTAELDDLKGPFTDYANALHGMTGLVCKTWIRDGSTLGGFHIFTSREAANSYLSSELVAGLISNEAFSDFQIRHFDVLDEFKFFDRQPREDAGIDLDGNDSVSRNRHGGFRGWAAGLGGDQGDQAEGHWATV